MVEEQSKQETSVKQTANEVLSPLAHLRSLMEANGTDKLASSFLLFLDPTISQAT
jgi:hypothetical protein